MEVAIHSLSVSRVHIACSNLGMAQRMLEISHKRANDRLTIGKPMRGQEILSLAKKHNVRFVHAPEDKILDARAAIARRGIYCEHTTAANYAAYLEYCRLYGKTPDTLITMCGAGLKSDH